MQLPSSVYNATTQSNNLYTHSQNIKMEHQTGDTETTHRRYKTITRNRRYRDNPKMVMFTGHLTVC